MADSAIRYGNEVPRVFTPPLGELTPETSAGFAACEFAELIGVKLYPWQKWLLIHGLELREDGDFRFKTVVVEVARQNGKTTLMKVLGLWRLFVYGASEIVSTAQNLAVSVATLEEAFRLAAFNPVLRQFLRDNPRAEGDMDPYNGAWISRGNGKNHFTLKTAPVPEALDPMKMSMPKWSVAVSGRTGGRSISADLVFLDELREHLDYEGWSAAVPTTISRPHSQVWAFSNAGDRRSVVLRDQRAKAIEALEDGSHEKSRLALFSWSASPERSIHDVEGFAEANPSMGYGAMTVDTLASEAASAANPDKFRTEHLCQWVEHVEQGKVTARLWESTLDEESTPAPEGALAVGVDVAPDGAFASIAVAGEREDGRVHVEVIAHRAGFRWVPEFLAARRDLWFDGRVGLQTKGAPSATLAPFLEDAGFTVVPWQGADMSRSVIGYYDALREGGVRHRDQPLLAESAQGVRERSYGDLFFWDRGKSLFDPSPFVATNVAWWLLTSPPTEFVSAYAAEDFDSVDVDDTADDTADGLLIV